MRANLWTSLGTVGPGLAVRSLICLVLATGCTDPPLTGSGDPGPPPAPPNQQPRPQGPQGSIPPQELQEGAQTTLNMGSYFSDPDSDQLTYSATSQPANVFVVTLSGSGGSMVTIRGVDMGKGTVTVTATDPGGLNAIQSFNVTVTERPVGVCMRTPQVRDAILAAVGVTDCNSLTGSQLAGIDSLDVSESGLSGLKEDDFELLPGLTVLRLGSNRLSQLRPNVFSGLDSLAVLDLSNNSLQELRAGVFSGLSSLIDLEMHNNALSQIREGAFSGLSTLKQLGLDANELSGLRPAVFSDLSNLDSLDLGANRLSSLEDGVFSGLSSLKELKLHTNQLSVLRSAVFSGLSNLESLQLSNNRLSLLEDGVFSGLSSLKELELHTNQLSVLRSAVFSGLSNLESLQLSNNQLRKLHEGVFSGLSSLKELLLDTNKLESLPRGVFAGLSELRSLTLEGNPGTKFGLMLRFERTDATSPSAPGPTARVRVVLAKGAPFAFNVPVHSRGGMVSPSSVPFAKGDTVSSRDFTVRQTSASNPARITAPSLPDAPDAITGVELVAPDELVLFDPNQAPEATGMIRSMTRTVRSRQHVGFIGYFSDPDGDTLRFRPRSSDRGIVEVRWDQSYVIIRMVAAGTATVTLTATDPGGLSASTAFNVTVVDTRGTVLRDDFDNAGIVKTWLYQDASLEVSDSVLRVTPRTPRRDAKAIGFPGRTTSWEIRARMGALGGVRTGLEFTVSDDDEFDFFKLDIDRTPRYLGGERVNYTFSVLRRGADGLYRRTFYSNLSGMSDAINVGAGEFTEITVRVQDGTFEALAGADTLFSLPVAETVFGPSLLEIRQVHFVSRDPAGTNPGLLDWIEVIGVSSGSWTNADRDSRPRLAQPDFLRDLQAVQEVPRAVCQTRKCP